MQIGEARASDRGAETTQSVNNAMIQDQVVEIFTGFDETANLPGEQA